jgi:hypothetical protein
MQMEQLQKNNTSTINTLGKSPTKPSNQSGLPHLTHQVRKSSPPGMAPHYRTTGSSHIPATGSPHTSSMQDHKSSSPPQSNQNLSKPETSPNAASVTRDTGTQLMLVKLVLNTSRMKMYRNKLV